MANINPPEIFYSDISVIACREYIDASNSGVFERHIQSLFAEGKPKIVIDMRELRYLASTGCNVLLGNLAAARSHGGDIVLLAPPQEVLDVLELLGALQLIPVAEDRNSVIAHFRRQASLLETGEMTVDELVEAAGGLPDNEGPLDAPPDDDIVVADPLDIIPPGEQEREIPEAESVQQPLPESKPEPVPAERKTSEKLNGDSRSRIRARKRRKKKAKKKNSKSRNKNRKTNRAKHRKKRRK